MLSTEFNGGNFVKYKNTKHLLGVLQGIFLGEVMPLVGG
jgi:hypothetical protein